MQPSAVPILIGLLVAATLIIIILWQRYVALLQTHEAAIKDARQRSVAQSRSTLKGQIAEQMAPLLPGFPYSAADARFLGDPIDYVVFKGRSDFADLEEEDGLEIILVEVKQGQSRLSPVQRAIANAIEAGRVRFEINYVTEDGITTATACHPGRRLGSLKAKV
jgi:predicted Holliday junction resolvase-like endonuclease